MFTMGDVARCSLGKPDDYHNAELLYRLFGVNAELLIDHAWGVEPCTIADIKAYRPAEHSLVSGQVLKRPYRYDETRLVVREMADGLALELLEKKLVTDQLVLTVGYDTENLTDPQIRKQYHGPVVTDTYGRKVPKAAHGTENMGRKTASSRLMTDAVMTLFDRIVDRELLIRRISLSANRVIHESAAVEREVFEQLDLFTDYEERDRRRKEEDAVLEREKRAQEAVLKIKKKFGKNAIIKGMSLEEGATAQERNNQIGGHRA